MYVFGGRAQSGRVLGDLAAFRISSRRWYTFQNMGPAPSPRSGHVMATIGNQIVVIGCEEPCPGDEQVTVLDTSKIKYPVEELKESTMGPSNVLSDENKSSQVLKGRLLLADDRNVAYLMRCSGGCRAYQSCLALC
jgi:hypothetical protein